MPIKNTERKISAGTNIHGHETSEELLKKRETKIQKIDKELSTEIIKLLNAGSEESDKISNRIKSLQKITDITINKIFCNQTKYDIIKIRKNTKNKINNEISNRIDTCNELRNYIIKNELNRKYDIKNKVLEFQKKKIEIEKVVDLLENAYFYYQEDLEELNWHMSYLKKYLQ